MTKSIKTKKELQKKKEAPNKQPSLMHPFSFRWFSKVLHNPSITLFYRHVHESIFHTKTVNKCNGLVTQIFIQIKNFFDSILHIISFVLNFFFFNFLFSSSLYNIKNLNTELCHCMHFIHYLV